MSETNTHERRFNGKPDRLRSAERLARLEVEHVVALSMLGLDVKSMLDVGTGTGIFAQAFYNSDLEGLRVEQGFRR